MRFQQWNFLQYGVFRNFKDNWHIKWRNTPTEIFENINYAIIQIHEAVAWPSDFIKHI